MDSARLAEFVANHALLVAITAGVLIALVATESARFFRKYRAVSPAQLTQLINRENALVIDVGSLADYEAGHIVGAKHIAPSQFDPENRELAKVRDLPVAVYCKTGQASAQAAARLGKAGFGKVYWLDGGLGAWLAADLPVTRGRANRG
ncbi:MAG TPA: rhodanese-like domain-containing protein [Xanthomonadales bacterium]|nr:rhodanese-like domain-containing protein [Xanthomonadales bacterium]